MLYCLGCGSEAPHPGVDGVLGVSADLQRRVLAFGRHESLFKAGFNGLAACKWQIYTYLYIHLLAYYIHMDYRSISNN